MARKKIVLLGDPIINEEEVALEALVPGHLLELTATGVQKNTDDAANVAVAVALERDELGKEIGPTGTGLGQTGAAGPAGAAEYAIGDTVKVGTFAPGMRAYMFLASGQNVAKGAYLTGTTTGLLTATGVTASVRLARALEAVNASGSAPVAGTRIRVEIV